MIDYIKSKKCARPNRDSKMLSSKDHMTGGIYNQNWKL